MANKNSIHPATLSKANVLHIAIDNLQESMEKDRQTLELLEILLANMQESCSHVFIDFGEQYKRCIKCQKEIKK